LKRLLVVADDFGLTPGVNRGIATAFREGILTSASLLTNTSHLDQTLSLARMLPGLKVGVHLTLVGGRPVLEARKVPSLAPREGKFRDSWQSFLPAWTMGRVREEEVRSEWRAQVARALGGGIRPAHLDSHQHLHVLPALWRVVMDLAREFGISRVRILREPGGAPRGVPLSRRLVRSALSRLSPAPPSAYAAGCCCDYFFGAAEAGHLDLAALLAVLRRIPEGWSELVTHPADPDPELDRDYRWGYHWGEETRALVSQEARSEVDRLGIALVRG